MLAVYSATNSEMDASEWKRGSFLRVLKGKENVRERVAFVENIGKQRSSNVASSPENPQQKASNCDRGHFPISSVQKWWLQWTLLLVATPYANHYKDDAVLDGMCSFLRGIYTQKTQYLRKETQPTQALVVVADDEVVWAAFSSSSAFSSSCSFGEKIK
ncbi:hypothetical protein GH714_027307 [Hevea brasiliensis]|uniref:Uncharacterized protein n=1 Tax=Hevea brasiliensis TaxID=3981 RepID=A0A6A6MDZ2_HEVBR|nr:hypothetical protein GH714_027307 [Hevea brasiliensis]